MKKIRLRKSRCIGENPVFPEVFYQYVIFYPDSLNFRDVTRKQRLLTIQPWTPNISKKIQILNGWISHQEFVLYLRYQFCWDSSSTDIHRFLPPLHLLCLNYVPHFIYFTIIEQFYQTRPQERSIPLTGLNVYLISCINKDYWLIATVDATR